MIFITGSEGLIGRHLTSRIEAAGISVRRFDIRRYPEEDLCNPDALAPALANMQGIVHLAAVSRVIWGERDPEYCWSVNVQAMRSLLHLCMNLSARPWLIFASSREVYGNATTIPVSEDAEFKPLNTYARSKSEGERLVQAATRDGLLANICRLSSVYGCPWDYRDRVVMAFARTAASGGTMRLEGATNTFDFTQVGDVVEGLWRVVEATMARERLPPIHFVTGEGTSLLQLAKIAERNALKPVRTRGSSFPRF